MRRTVDPSATSGATSPLEEWATRTGGSPQSIASMIVLA